MTTDAYIRFPDVRGDNVVFVAENDVWLASTAGGRAYRVSADNVPARSPRISPNGDLVAWAANRDGAQEVYVAPLEGGVSKRLTFWGQAATTVRGWVSDTEVLVVSTVGEPERQCSFAHAVPVDGSPSRRLPYGWVDELAFGPDGGVLITTSAFVEPAWWKRYRGGTAATLWLDTAGNGDFRRIFADLASGLVSPLWVRGRDGKERIGFISDHGGRAQVYSAPLRRRGIDAKALVRHTDHDYYARQATSDGRRVVYVSGGSLYLLESLDAGTEPHRVDVRLGGPRTAQQPKRIPVDAGKVDTIGVDKTGRASVIESRGTIQWVTHRDGPVRALADGSGVRRRLPALLGDSGWVAWVTDGNGDGDDAVEVANLASPDASAAVVVAAGKLGRVLETTGSPDGKQLAVASHDGRLLLVSLATDKDGAPTTGTARVREVDQTTMGDVQGLAFSPDSRWLAWSAPGVEPLRHIRMVDLAARRGKPFDVTPLRFTDTEPAFTLDGLHLAFLSVRSLDPVYDAFVFDLSFPNGCRPYVVPLAIDTPSPFEPQLGGRPTQPDEQKPDASGAGDTDKEKDAKKADAPPQTKVDVEGLDQRLVAVPVAGARYSSLRAVKGGLVWLKQPLRGELGDDLPKPDDQPLRSVLEHIDLATGRTQTLVDAADWVVASGDGTRLAAGDQGAMRMLPATSKADKESPDVVEVDLSRVRIEVLQQAEWTQMLHEAWRLMRDHFWRADMNGVDWKAALDRYVPLLPALGSHDDLVDLIWEMHGELGSSHAYCRAPDSGGDPARRQGLLGADIEYRDGRWQITRIVPGETSERRARSPLTAPGVGAKVGDAIVAVDGRPTSASVSPNALLVGTATKPVELTLAPASGGANRRVVAVPLADEFPLRYQDWVNGRREYVHQQTDGKIGYVHVPDMVSGGWAQLHRDLRTEVSRDALIVDVRGNSGGHTSALVIEKLARRIIGWDVSRGYPSQSYPGDARRGPMVTITDLWAGSDGDIVTAAIQALELGPVIGTRTWGGVIGIDGRYTLIDGTRVTQPRYSFWFEKFGWDVENHGVDPDIEVVARPQDRVTRNDVQLDYAIRLVGRLLKKTPPKNPPTLPAKRW